MKYKARIADSLLKEKLGTFGAVLIIGPKGCGKTTTAKQQSKSVIEFQDGEKRDQYLSTAKDAAIMLLIKGFIAD